MSDEMGVVETGEPVETGASPAPEGVDGSPPEGEAPAQETGAEVLPFGKHPRWQKMTSENKALRSQLAEYQAKMKELEGSAATARWLKEDPKGFYAYLKSQIKEDPETPQKDPYEAFEPEVAERFRKYDKALEEAEKAKQEAETRSKQTYEERVQSNRQELDQSFDQMLAESKITAESAGEDFIELIAHATLSKLTSTAKDPNLPTKAELKAAFESVTNGLKKAGKVFSPKASPVPPSGSGKGTLPTGKAKGTPEEREAARIADILNGF